MTNDVTLVFPDIKGRSGTRSYVENTMNGLSKIGVKFDRIPVRKREVSINGKPYFGIVFQYLSSLSKNAGSKVVHSLSPDVVVKGTNVVTVHDIIPFTNPEIYMKSYYDKLAYKLSFSRSLKVKTILLSSEVGKKEFKEKTGLDDERLRVIHHSIDHSKFFPEKNSPYPDDGKINIVMVSDFNPRKRIDKVIDAIGGDDEINFYHIGPSQGWNDRYKAIILSGLRFKNVKFLGKLDAKKLREYLTFADLFIFLSESEGFGLPPLEAMACGTNVLVNNLPVFQETMGDMAFFSSLTEFDKFSIVSAIKNKKNSSELIEFSARYSIMNHARKLFEVYSEEILGGKLKPNI